MQLNPEQLVAVRHEIGPMLILAGAGSGKTRVLVERTKHLMRKELATPDRICVLTFTNKAARELKERLSDPKAKKIWAGTFHSFGLQILKKYHEQVDLPKHFSILSPGDSKAILKELLQNARLGKDNFDLDKVLAIMSRWRERGQTRAKTDDEYEVACEFLLPKYLQRMKSLGAVDFDSLLQMPVLLCETNSKIKKDMASMFDQIMVDEFQDTNPLQMKMLDCLMNKEQNITVVGDDDQSIYGWRGAEIQNILRFPKLFKSCKVVRLERNYRSTPSILNIANSIISKNQNRHKKVLISEAKSLVDRIPELFVFEEEYKEAEAIIGEIQKLHSEGLTYKDMSILYRSNSQSIPVETLLKQNNIPYKVTGGMAFFDRKECKDILAYLRCCVLPNEVSLRRALHAPPRGIGDQSLEKVAEYQKQQKLSFSKALKAWRQIGIQERIGEKIQEFFEELFQLRRDLLDLRSKNPSQVLIEYLQKNHYREYLEKQSKDLQKKQAQWNLVENFCQILDRYMAPDRRNLDSLIAFLEALELRDQLQDKEDDSSSVQLMTLHSAKGLEFPAVFLIGVEEDILPHKNLGEDISEERRLFYVGVTRAKEYLMMSYCRQRKRYGKLQDVAPSRFLLEIPEGMYRKYLNGFRPINSQERKSMLDDLFKKIDATSEKRSI